MADVIHLIRHGEHALLGRVLCGRMAGVGLDEFGRRQMAACASRLSPRPSMIQSSPRLRALQSANILAEPFRLPVEVVSDMDEIDVGDWTSASFAELDRDPHWQRWNARRGSNAPPNGESMQALQVRVVRHLVNLAREASCRTVAIVSHAEPIRAALLHFKGIPLDDFLSIEVAPASISTLTRDRGRLRVAEINQKVPA